MTTTQTAASIVTPSTWIDPFEVDLPGELDNIIPFPGWEPDDDPPAACALCAEPGADDETGVCSICAGRLPRVGGCGLGLRLVAGLTGANDGPALAHLADCPDCADFFSHLAFVASVAEQEADHLAERWTLTPAGLAALRAEAA